MENIFVKFNKKIVVVLESDTFYIFYHVFFKKISSTNIHVLDNWNFVSCIRQLKFVYQNICVMYHWLFCRQLKFGILLCYLCNRMFVLCIINYCVGSWNLASFELFMYHYVVSCIINCCVVWFYFIYVYWISLQIVLLFKNLQSLKY